MAWWRLGLARRRLGLGSRLGLVGLRLAGSLVGLGPRPGFELGLGLGLALGAYGAISR